MSNHRDHNVKQRRSDHTLKSLPSEVLLKARSTLVSLGGALKPKHDQNQKTKVTKQQLKDKKNNEKLKTSHSEPEFNDIRKNIKNRSRIEENNSREYTGAARPRPLSVGALKRYNSQIDDFVCGSFPRDVSPLRQRRFESSEDVCVQSKLVIPVADRFASQEVQVHEVNERPRKKLSFREPEIVGSGSATLGRSHKLMGVNSLTLRPNRLSVRSESKFASVDGLDSDLESQAMRIVRTVGQAFEVCHKMQVNSPEQPVPSTSSANNEPVPTDQTSDVAASKEEASECGASESGAASTSKVVVEEGAVGGEELSRPKHLDLLPPPPRKEGKRTALRTTPAPNINLPELPECITKVELSNIEGDTSTPLSAQHQLQLLRERLEQQAQQTRAAVAQLLLLRDQLAAEQSARYEAQARTHQLLVHNKELLEHIAALVSHLQERERGSSRPISAQQLTLLPQMKVMEASTETNKTEKIAAHNGNKQPLDTDSLINLFAQSNKVTQNVENNNICLSPYHMSPNIPSSPVNGPKKSSAFDSMSNEDIQNYLIEKFQKFDFGSENTEPSPSAYSSNQHFFQNSRAFPNIPLLTNHYSSSDLASLLDNQHYEENELGEFGGVAQPMIVGHSQNSLSDTSKDSSPTSSEEGVPFIMPLSHNGTLAATGEDGRVRLIVPVSPSPSSSEVVSIKIEAPPESSGATLKVPEADRPNPSGPITRSTSEKVPNRSEMMTALRAQWTRHTTK